MPEANKVDGAALSEDLVAEVERRGTLDPTELTEHFEQRGSRWNDVQSALQLPG